MVIDIIDNDKNAMIGVILISNMFENNLLFKNQVLLERSQLVNRKYWVHFVKYFKFYLPSINK